ncbi:D-alanyl-D-alanine carboxypeptidase family protein [uncultured Clostridium sp.]|uniref:D-alanyl-D-alanine carboxypeptidase family protein n=1 Tax=uncultured Clostridium sp. TaxID=59620 RepID=UPI0028E1F1EB|nr:D-alanyl-D-alanine carboxypeptidase family protein [uncultured Clostridium sp.]
MRKVHNLLIFILIISIILNSKMVSAKSNPPSVSADGAILMDATTGEILFQKNMDKPYPPASTTKIMTALLTLENTKLDDVVTVGKKPPFADGSKIYIFEGEQITVSNLLYALLLESANDAAEALAEHISGSVEEFAKLMNERAKELGCENTNFVNPNGLYDDKHRTSAKDLALMMRELVKHPEYIEISTSLSYKIAPTNKSKAARPLWNKNKLVQQYSTYYYDGIEGGKTGYTVQSEHSYVASAQRNNQRLIVSFIYDKNKTYFPDAIKLFDYGFNNYQLVKMFSKDEVVTEYNEKDLNVKLLASEDFYYIKEKDADEKAVFNLENKDLSRASFKKSDNIINATISFNDKNIGTLKLLSDSDHIIKENTTTKVISKINSNVVAIASLLLSIIIIALVIIYRKNKLRKIF